MKKPEQYLIDAGWNDFRTNGKSFKQIALDAIEAAINDRNDDDDDYDPSYDLPGGHPGV